MKALARKNGFGMTDVPRDAKLEQIPIDFTHSLHA
jgi:hypothetical protein